MHLAHFAAAAAGLFVIFDLARDRSLPLEVQLFYACGRLGLYKVL